MIGGVKDAVDAFSSNSNPNTVFDTHWSIRSDFRLISAYNKLDLAARFPWFLIFNVAQTKAINVNFVGNQMLLVFGWNGQGTLFLRRHGQMDAGGGGGGSNIKKQIDESNAFVHNTTVADRFNKITRITMCVWMSNGSIYRRQTSIAICPSENNPFDWSTETDSNDSIDWQRLHRVYVCGVETVRFRNRFNYHSIAVQLIWFGIWHWVRGGEVIAR